MDINYDPEVDVLSILFSSQAIEESDEDKPGVIIDYDKEGNIVGIEVLEASKWVENPRTLEYNELQEEFNVTGGLKEHDRKVVMELKSRLPADLHKH